MHFLEYIMPSSAIVGWSGFIGQYLTQFFPESDLYNSGNIETIRNKHYDTIYFSAMPAEKWRINQDPTADEKLLHYFIDILTGVSCNEFILISTVDVLDCTSPQREDGAVYASHPYGIHRRILEEFIAKQYSNHIILRLPGLFGKGLKKNILYDLLHNNQLANICLESEFQWYNLEYLRDDIDYCKRNTVRLINLVSEPITTDQIVSRYFPESKCECKGVRSVSYRLSTYHPLHSSSSVFDDIGNYICWYRSLQEISKIATVSNIAWKSDQLADASKILRRYNINRIEMAFTTIRDWSDWDTECLEALSKSGYVYPSCQSILYKTDIEIFRDQSVFIEHYRRVVSLCRAVGVKSIVFGSPKARHIHTTSESERIDLFRILGEISRDAGVYLCMEPNSSAYGCTWLTNLAQTYEFVCAVSHPHICINFDFGNYTMENDTTELTKELVARIANVQISAPYLRGLDCSLVKRYREIYRTLRTLGYNDSVSLEMVTARPSELVISCAYFIDVINGNTI
jgi:sugar phosphate isomerase/epimerase